MTAYTTLTAAATALLLLTTQCVHGATLARFTLPPATAAPADVTPLTLKWSIEDPTSAPYYNFVFTVTDAQSGAILAKSAPTPAGSGTQQTTLAYTLPPTTANVHINVAAMGSLAPTGVRWTDSPNFSAFDIAVQGRSAGPSSPPGSPPMSPPGSPAPPGSPPPPGSPAPPGSPTPSSSAVPSSATNAPGPTSPPPAPPASDPPKSPPTMGTFVPAGDKTSDGMVTAPHWVVLALGLVLTLQLI